MRNLILLMCIVTTVPSQLPSFEAIARAQSYVAYILTSGDVLQIVLGPRQMSCYGAGSLVVSPNVARPGLEPKSASEAVRKAAYLDQ